MTQLQILKYAYNGCLEVWAREYDRLGEDKANSIVKARFERYDADLEAIRDLLRTEEQKCSHGSI